MERSAMHAARLSRSTLQPHGVASCGEPCLQEGLEVCAHVCWKCNRILHNLVDQGVYGGGVEGGLAHKELVQDDAQAPQISLQGR